MQADFHVESRSYDQMVRGKWRGYRLAAETRLGDEAETEVSGDCLRLWLPAGTPMNWSHSTRPLRSHCVQFYWPGRWYTLSAFYEGRTLLHTYAAIILPADFFPGGLVYVDLDLTLLVRPDLSYDVLTQVEFEKAAEALGYSEDVRIGAWLALETITNATRLGRGLFGLIPRTLNQTDFHLEVCQ